MRKWLKRNALSILIGCLLGGLAGYGHLKSVEQYKEQQHQLAEEAREYDREVEAERMRWERMELNEVELAEIEYATAMEALNEEDPEYDPDIPVDVQEAAWKYGKEYNICPEFLMAVAKKESTYDPSASNGGCIGLMQVSLKWHRDRMERLGVSEDDMWTVDGSMHVASDYMAELFDKYEDPAMVLMVYNGDSRADAFSRGECQMSGYASEILETARSLEEKHGKLFTALRGSQAFGADYSEEVVALRV